jgi:hypothetical protein
MEIILNIGCAVGKGVSYMDFEDRSDKTVPRRSASGGLAAAVDLATSRQPKQRVR